MISERYINKFCNGDITKIENYEQALNDETQVWDCHHRLETHFSDGAERPSNAQLSIKELKALDMYFNRPPEELIFLTRSNHRRLHMLGKKFHAGTGQLCSEETKRKISKANKGKKMSEEARKKISETLKGRKLSEETRKKMSEARKGKHWKLVDGKRV